MSARSQALKAHCALFNGSGELSYFEQRALGRSPYEWAERLVPFVERATREEGGA